MKPNELMVGDWVYIPRLSKTACVTGVNSDNQEINTNLGHIPARFGISPIDLTKYILEENGWRNIRGNIYGARFEENTKLGKLEFDIPFRVCISDSYCHEKIISTTSEDVVVFTLYVHELQHALRLCGLNDLANNIKIQ